MSTTKLIDFPKEVIAAYNELSSDLRNLESNSHSNQMLKVILNFIGNLEITNGVVLYNNLESAAQGSHSHIAIGSRDVTQHYASEAKPSEGERNLNEPREAVGLIENLEVISQRFQAHGIKFSYWINHNNVSPSRSK